MEQNKGNFKPLKGEWDFNRKDSYVVNFKGRNFGKCTPTDLDWVLEIRDKVLIFAEVKRSEKINGLPIGQKILAQNLCRYISSKIIPVYFLYVQGVVENNQIEIENAKVLSVYSNFNKQWLKKNILFKDAINLIIKKHCI
jgi:hypothetical protein